MNGEQAILVLGCFVVLTYGVWTMVGGPIEWAFIAMGFYTIFGVVMAYGIDYLFQIYDWLGDQPSSQEATE